ncbi:macro domain-containing protein [Streptomyces chrestomyceticus]|uniref:macro domain-containing protein n=1 Tax=Streptomyces chrestomyceticus TaxID=68185 RepID=UPI0033EF0472
MPVNADDYTLILGELKDIRRAGLTRLRTLRLPVLERAAAARAPDGAIEELLRSAVSRLDEGNLRTAAAYTLGLAQGTRDWPAADRRRRSAEIYGVSTERFRKDQEVMVLGQVAEAIARTTETPGTPTGQIAATHRLFSASVGSHSHTINVHVHPVDMLRDIDAVVSPTNVFLALPEPYKSSISASLRRAGAVQAATGEVLTDQIQDELRTWAAQHGALGRPVAPGTVTPTSAGTLAGQGIRRIYHAAIAVPRSGTNDYDVLPADITRAAARSLALLAEERHHFDPPLRSVCFPLLGAGRGGLPYEISIGALWAAVEADLARGAEWDIHFVVRNPAAAAILEQLPARIRPESALPTTRRTGSL